MKRRNKAKYLTWNFARLINFVKNSMSNPIQKPWIYQLLSSNSPRTIKSPSRYDCKKYATSSIGREDLKPYILEIRNKSHISLGDQQCYYYKDFMNHRKKTNTAVVFSCWPFPHILKYRDHWWNLPTIWETRLLQTLIKELRKKDWRKLMLTVL